LEDADQVIPVLLPEGTVITEVLHELLVALGRDTTFAGNEQDGVTGQDADEGKGDDRDADERRQDQQQPFGEEAKHLAFVVDRGAVATTPRSSLLIRRYRRRRRRGYPSDP